MPAAVNIAAITAHIYAQISQRLSSIGEENASCVGVKLASTNSIPCAYDKEEAFPLSSPEKNAEPDTAISTPASVTEAIVSAFMPPSADIRYS